MLEKIKECYSRIFNVDKVNSVYEVFKEYYGENKVDLQNPWTEEYFIEYLNVTPIIHYINKDLYLRNHLLVIEVPKLSEVSTDIATYILDNFERLLNDTVFKTTILIWWPKVTITNENDRSTDITHLYGKVLVKFNGKLVTHFTLNRAEYTMDQYRNNYMHSHVCDIPKHDPSSFQHCCTGRGPINDTMCNLIREYDLDIWNLFCVELDKYVHVESISGTPYHYLERLGTFNNNLSCSNFLLINTFPFVPNNTSFNAEALFEFYKYFIKKKLLRFNFCNNCFFVGMSFTDYVILVSNIFIEWYNDKYNKKELTDSYNALIGHNIIKKCIIENGTIYYDNTEGSCNWEDNEGKYVCTFKGSDITVHITHSNTTRDNRSIVLNLDYCTYLLVKILKLINYKYGRNNDEGAIYFL